MYKTFLLKDEPVSAVQSILNHVVAPRPICFASTVDAQGCVNLSPFSYFNMFSFNPPVVIFSPLLRVRNNTAKHTLENLKEVGEVCVNIVSYDMVQQVSLASSEFPKGVDEFVKAGFTKASSQLIQPPRVQESPVQMECRVIEIKSLGIGGGAGNLVIAKVLMVHIHETLFTDEKLDQTKFDFAARMGGHWYARVSKENMFQVERPDQKTGMGIDNLPESIRSSKILTGNDLGRLANVHEMPAIDISFEDARLKNIFQYYSIDPEEMEKELHTYAAELLRDGKVNEAWQVLLANN
ncbi:MAG TPA: flavin reductase family protein [Chitinophagaceae bacterium]|nr:flavin reductase family protein [Chitinophagaceae bacterium]